MDDRTTPGPIEITGLVVHAAPGRGAAVAAALERIAGVVLHASSPEGKLVVTTEAPDEAGSIALFERIRLLEGVSSVAMAYHQIENEPDQEA